MSDTIYQVISACIGLLLLASPGIQDYQRGVKLLAENDLPGAELAASAALRKDPRYVPAIELMARLEMIGNRMEQARSLLEQAVARQPDDKSLRFLLGFCLYLQNDFEPARKALSKADQGDARVLLYLGLTEEGLNDFAAATAFYERALSLSAGSAEIRVAFARLLRNEGQTDRAESLMDDALRLAPGDRAALYEKSQCLLARGEGQLAAEFGERALAAAGVAPAEREIRYLLVRAYLKAGDELKAADHRAAFEKLPLPLVR